MTETKSSKDSAAGEDRFFLLAIRSGIDAAENIVVSAAEIPLGALSTLGVSSEATDAARKTHQELTQGITGTVDSIVTQIADAVSKTAQVATETVTAVAKKASEDS